MALDAYIGTKTGVQRLRDGALEPLGLDGERVSAIHASAGDGGSTVLLAGTYGNGLYRSTDGGGRWERVEDGLSASAFRFIAPDPGGDPGALLAGTEPARLFRSRDGGESWRELDGVTRIPGHDRWFLPYSPRAGATRNVYSPPGRPRTLLASVEVGGLLRSEDAGETWRCAPVIADQDIHHVTGDPRDPDTIYVSLGTALIDRPGPGEPAPQLGGIARSRDGGATWEKVETDYTRATIVPPSHPELLLAGPAPRVGRGGRIVVSGDGGDSWEPAGAGIEIPMPDMVELFVPAPDGAIWAICARGRLLRAEPGDWTWRTPLPEDAAVEAESVAFVGDGAA